MSSLIDETVDELYFWWDSSNEKLDMNAPHYRTCYSVAYFEPWLTSRHRTAKTQTNEHIQQPFRELIHTFYVENFFAVELFKNSKKLDEVLLI